MPTVDQVVAGYITLRDTKKAIQDRHKEELKQVNANMEKMENWLLQQLNNQHAESIRTTEGTVFKHTRTSAKVVDWDAVLTYIHDNDAWDLLEKRVSKVSVEERAEQGEAVPGVTITRDTVAQIRRS